MAPALTLSGSAAASQLRVLVIIKLGLPTEQTMLLLATGYGYG